MTQDLFGPADAAQEPGETTPASSLPRARGARDGASPRRGARRAVEPAAVPAALSALASALPAQIRLGTSSWSFPGWDGLVYDGDYSEASLAKQGLPPYAAHPLLQSVSLDRSFYRPLTLADYLGYAGQTPAHFRFIVKAPASVTDAVQRDERGAPGAPNPSFLDPDLTVREFVAPCIEGLGTRAGVLLFQFSPLPQHMLADLNHWIERVGRFFAALPRLPQGTWYALEIRDAALLTPRLIKMLHATGVRYCIGIHARMPDVIRQATALAMLDALQPGPLIVRWSLHSGFKYEQAKAKYHPFNAIVDADPGTHAALAQLAAHYALAGQTVLITVNNKAEGSAPLSCFTLAQAIVAALAQARERAAT